MIKYNSKTKKGECIFCEIANGKIEPLGRGKFWETKKYVAWLSPFPNTEGFTIVMPKKHCSSDVLKMSDKNLLEFVLEAKKVSKVLINYFKKVGRVGLIMEGMGIDHAHIKLVPLQGTEYLKKGEWKQVHSKKNKYFKEYEGYISSHDGPKADEEKLKGLAKELKGISKRFKKEYSIKLGRCPE